MSLTHPHIENETNRRVEEHLCPKPLDEIHCDTQEVKSMSNLALREENSHSDDYGTLSSAKDKTFWRSKLKCIFLYLALPQH